MPLVGSQRRAFSSSFPPGIGRCADGDSSRLHGCRSRRAFVSQRRPALEVRRRKCGSCSARFPEAIRRTIEIADRCTFSFDELRYDYPKSWPRRADAVGALDPAYLGRQLASVIPSGIPEKVRQLLEHELQLIAELRYEAYFLTVWDLVRFARSRRHPLPRPRDWRRTRPCAIASASRRSIPSNGRALRAVHQPRTKRSSRYRR